jgi:hypothetical protein
MFYGFELREDGSDNLGSWMRLTEKGEKQLADMKAKQKQQKPSGAKS